MSMKQVTSPTPNKKEQRHSSTGCECSAQSDGSVLMYCNSSYLCALSVLGNTAIGVLMRDGFSAYKKLAKLVTGVLLLIRAMVALHFPLDYKTFLILRL